MPAISTVHRRQPPNGESSLCEHSDGHVDAGDLGGAQHGGPVRHRHALVIDLQLQEVRVRARQGLSVHPGLPQSAAPDSITMASPAMASKRQIS